MIFILLRYESYCFEASTSHLTRKWNFQTLQAQLFFPYLLGTSLSDGLIFWTTTATFCRGEKKHQILNDLFCLLGFIIWKYLLYGNNDSDNVTRIISGLCLLISFYFILIRTQMTYEAFNRCIMHKLILWTSRIVVIHI